MIAVLQSKGGIKSIAMSLGTILKKDLESKNLRRNLTFYYTLSRDKGASNEVLHNVTMNREMFNEFLRLNWIEKW